MRVGDRVRYIPSKDDDSIALWGSGNKHPAGVLSPKLVYDVERVDIHTWHTKVWLRGVGGPFNSAHFVPAGAVALETGSQP